MSYRYEMFHTMTVGDLRKLLDQFPDDYYVVTGSYRGNSPIPKDYQEAHIPGVYLPKSSSHGEFFFDEDLKNEEILEQLEKRGAPLEPNTLRLYGVAN
jgi:hypothetical protein